MNNCAKAASSGITANSFKEEAMPSHSGREDRPAAMLHNLSWSPIQGNKCCLTSSGRVTARPPDHTFCPWDKQCGVFVFPVRGRSFPRVCGWVRRLPGSLKVVNMSSIHYPCALLFLNTKDSTMMNAGGCLILSHTLHVEVDISETMVSLH